MTQEELVESVLEEVMKRVAPAGNSSPTTVAAAVATAPAPAPIPATSSDVVQLTEFVGTGMGDTQGIVIANLDSAIHDLMGIEEKYRSIGVIGSRVGAGPQIMATDDAVKATNTEIISVELPRDTKGGAGHGSLIVLGAEDVSDARRGVEVTLETLPKYFGDVYVTDQGHLELQYSARASRALEHVFNTPPGRAFGLVIGAPAVIGVLMIDTAVKSANVQPVGYMSPTKGTSTSNEVILAFSGDAGAVRQAVIAGREVGLQLLGAWGEQPQSLTQPYI